jgi:hypothetical protein
MTATHHLSRRAAAALAALVLAATALPSAAFAKPMFDGAGPRAAVSTKATAPTAPPPAPTVVRTVVQDDPVDVLPIVLAGAALLVAIAGTGYAMLRVAPLRHQLGGGH